jgi:diadenosine tetraphosphate (Ap4A) HIT family hydrolase
VSPLTACNGCAIVRRIESGDDPHSVARTRTGYVSIADCQYHEGYSIFLAKTCVAELHELDPDEQRGFLDEMALVAEAVFDAFAPRKLNYELLGNGVPHLHWHLFPRHADDPKPRGPVWEDEAFVAALNGGGAKATPAQLVELKRRLAGALAKHQGLVDTWYVQLPN